MEHDEGGNWRQMRLFHVCCPSSMGHSLYFLDGLPGHTKMIWREQGRRGVEAWSPLSVALSLPRVLWPEAP